MADDLTLNDDGTYTIIPEKSGDEEVIISEGLPEDFEPATGFDPTDPDQWHELMNSKDPTKRKSAMDVLKALGYEPTKYVHWTKPEKSLVLAAHGRLSAAGDEDEETSKKTSNKTKASKSKGKTKASSGSKSSGGTVDLSEVTDRLNVLEAEVEAQGAYIRETHALMRAFVTANPDVSDIAPDLVPEYYADLQFPDLAGNEEG